MKFLSRRGGIGEIEYDLETEEWIELSSTFLNQKTYLLLLKLLEAIKKQKFKHMITQRDRGQFISSSPIVTKINRKIILAFHYFACIEKITSQLFFMGDIENTNETIDIYGKYIKKIPRDWPICTSPDILRTLPKLKANLEKFRKHLLSTFCLHTKFYLEKKTLEEKNIKPLIKNTKTELKFLP